MRRSCAIAESINHVQRSVSTDDTSPARIPRHPPQSSPSHLRAGFHEWEQMETDATGRNRG